MAYSSSIYIPLCLYFNTLFWHCDSPPATFTFHYVSILMQVEMGSYHYHRSFTFHYVSILIFNFPYS